MSNGKPQRARHQPKRDVWALVVIAEVITLGVVVFVLVAMLSILTSGLSGGSTGSGIDLVAGAAAQVDPGAPGCANATGEICYSFALTVEAASFWQLQLSSIVLSVWTAGPTNWSSHAALVQQSGAALVGALDAQGKVVANASWLDGTTGGDSWTGQSNLSIIPGAQLVFDTGRTQDSLHGDYLWAGVRIPETPGAAWLLP